MSLSHGQASECRFRFQYPGTLRRPEPRATLVRMAIFKRGDTYYYEFVFNQKRYRESTHQGNQNVARTMESARRTALAKGEVGIKDKVAAPTLREFSDRFIKQIEMDCASKPQTIDFYRKKLKWLLNSKLADMRLDEIQTTDVESYKRLRRQSVSTHKKPISPATVNRELSTLRRLLRMAHEWRELDRLPRVKLLRGEGSREFVLSVDIEPKYLEALPAAMRDIAAVLIDTGLRVGEALKLEWGAVNLRQSPGSITVRAADSKNSKARTVSLTPRAHKILNGRRERSGLVFRKDDGSPLYHTWLDQQHAAVRTAMKLPEEFVLHSLRHTFGTRLGEAGADAFTIMKLMGHSTVTVSQKYVHPTSDAMKAAIERMGALSPVPPKLPTVVEMKPRRKAVSSQ
jgi:integrase